jgi:DnaK suppressor protein
MDEEQGRARLLARLAELEEEVRIGAEASEPVTLQQDSVGRLSRIDAMQQQAMAQAVQRRRIAEQHRVRAALVRLDGGEWGWCVTCGEEIAKARLAHDPSVAQYVGCASAASA